MPFTLSAYAAGLLNQVMTNVEGQINTAAKTAVSLATPANVENSIVQTAANAANAAAIGLPAALVSAANTMQGIYNTAASGPQAAGVAVSSDLTNLLNALNIPALQPTGTGNATNNLVSAGVNIGKDSTTHVASYNFPNAPPGSIVNGGVLVSPGDPNYWYAANGYGSIGHYQQMVAMGQAPAGLGPLGPQAPATAGSAQTNVGTDVTGSSIDPKTQSSNQIMQYLAAALAGGALGAGAAVVTHKTKGIKRHKVKRHHAHRTR